MPASGIQLTRDGKTVATDHAAAARELVGTGIWVAPVDLSSEPRQRPILSLDKIIHIVAPVP
jgi:hypothetical protein